MRQGFDDGYGLPYGNDMPISRSLKRSTDIKLREGVTLEKVWKKEGSTPPLLRGEGGAECHFLFAGVRPPEPRCA